MYIFDVRKETVYGKDAREEDAVASNHHPKD